MTAVRRSYQADAARIVSPPMGANAILARLDKVRSTGRGNWRATCPNPVHSKAKDTLSITEGDSGLVLLKCFACHDTPAILGAIGLELADLYPKRLADQSPAARREARDHFRLKAVAAAVESVAHEALVVAIAGSQIVAGNGLTNAEVKRVYQAELSIRASLEGLRA
jgi:hypothetical protein